MTNTGEKLENQKENINNLQKNIKEEFISTLSHEIRTPLTSIKGFCQTMLSSWDLIDENKKKEFLQIILSQSQRLINLVENVLNVAKIDSDSNNFILSKVDINTTVKNCINIIKMNHKDCVFDFKNETNGLFAFCDNDKTQQILLNVLDNACKYSKVLDDNICDDKKIEIKTFLKNEYCIVSILNFGNFIPEDKIDKIFDKFYRADSYISASCQGSGLGLYIVKTLLDKMQGKIEVKSDLIKNKENIGKMDDFIKEDIAKTEFLIYFPVYEVEKITKKLGVR